MEQSASLPGSVVFSSTLLRRVRSRALRAAMRAWAACTVLVMICLASAGFSSRNSANFWLTTPSTNPRISELPSLVLVWPSNWGSRSFTLRMATRPSRTSSPLRFSSFSLRKPLERA